MRKILIILLSITISCTDGKISHDEALAFFKTIRKTSLSEIEMYSRFINSFKKSIGTMQLDNPNKFDQAALKQFKTDYNIFISQLVRDIDQITKLKEVDTKINLKANFIKYATFLKHQ